jgi:hypothetical protein
MTDKAAELLQIPKDICQVKVKVTLYSYIIIDNSHIGDPDGPN